MKQSSSTDRLGQVGASSERPVAGAEGLQPRISNAPPSIDSTVKPHFISGCSPNWRYSEGSPANWFSRNITSKDSKLTGSKGGLGPIDQRSEPGEALINIMSLLS